MEEDEILVSMKVGKKELYVSRESAKSARKLVAGIGKCIGCGLCVIACPFEAMTLGAVGATSRGILKSPGVYIDPEKCLLCGICAGTCLFNVYEFNTDDVSFRDDEGYPRLKGVFDLDEEKCKPKDEKERLPCKECEEACPTEAIKSRIVIEKGKVRNVIDFDESECIYCGACARACKEEAIKVEKVFEGEHRVDLEACQGCGVCVEICPSKAIAIPKAEAGEKTDKVSVDTETCIYCGACENACPVDAMKVERTKVRYEKGKMRPWTGLWEEAFEKLAEAGKKDDDVRAEGG